MRTEWPRKAENELLQIRQDVSWRRCSRRGGGGRRLPQVIDDNVFVQIVVVAGKATCVRGRGGEAQGRVYLVGRKDPAVAAFAASLTCLLRFNLFILSLNFLFFLPMVDERTSVAQKAIFSLRMLRI